MEKSKLQIVKIGGNVIDNQELLNSFLNDFSKMSSPKILVHGGGKKATNLAEKLGLQPKMINGRRITDDANLEVVTMVYAGLLNKNIVAKLQAKNCNAVGLTGTDGNVIKAHKRIVNEIDYGFAGDVNEVNSGMIHLLLKNTFTPVFCAITHNKKGQLLNTNADTVASEIAIAMSNLYEVELDYIFELQGVLQTIEDENSVIEKINAEKLEKLTAQGIISSGMLPKLHNCFNALEKGVSRVKIGDVTLIKKEKNKHTTLSLV